MREEELLRHIRDRSTDLGRQFPHVLTGPGDDCAVVRMLSGDPLLLKVDQLVEGRHFRPYPATPIELVARKAIARSVSDIAAMAGTPACALASATLPDPCPWADTLFDHMARWARHWNCPLVGGDIASWEKDEETRRGGQAPTRRAEETREPDAQARDPAACPGLVLSVTILGTPHPTRGPVLRSTARPGDAVYVTGPLGGSFDPATGLGKHLTFEPRLAEARALCDALGDRLHAMMDISDGLGIDAGRLAAASGVRIELDAQAIPRAKGVQDWRRAAADGEDYELLFTAGNPTDQDLRRLAPIRIGSVVEGSGCVIIENGLAHDAASMGWQHL